MKLSSEYVEKSPLNSCYVREKKKKQHHPHPSLSFFTEPQPKQHIYNLSQNADIPDGAQKSDNPDRASKAGISPWEPRLVIHFLAGVRRPIEDVVRSYGGILSWAEPAFP